MDQVGGVVGSKSDVFWATYSKNEFVGDVQMVSFRQSALKGHATAN